MAKHIQTMYDHWIHLFICLVVVMCTQVHGVNITRLYSALPKGTACLDGSPPAYYHDKGFGEGVNNWFIFLEGGGWCSSKKDCVDRSHKSLGTTKDKKDTVPFGLIFGKEKDVNPDFFNWNRVTVTYCDGSSFSGDVETIDPETNLTLRGARIFNAVMEDLLAKGMKNANNALLSGTSAGGLSTILHCDIFRALIPQANRVKCISDSGFIIRGEDLPHIELRDFSDVVSFHEIAKFLPRSCTSKMNASLCMFPENLIRHIQTPLFLLESAFDSFQISYHMVPTLPSDKPTWENCTSDLKICTPTQLQTMKDFRMSLIKTLGNIRNTPSLGMFIHSCFRHGHFYFDDGWQNLPPLRNKTIINAIGDWYFERSSNIQVIDTKHDSPLNCSSMHQ